MPRVKDLSGIRFGLLVAVEVAGEDVHHRKNWLCKCDCGSTKVVASRHLMNGGTRSCGCAMHAHPAKSCLGKTGPEHPRWKGGKGRRDGYVWIYVGPGVYIQEHRAAIDAPEGCVVHHRDGDKTNNDPSNLVVMTRSEHALEHGFGSLVRHTRAAEEIEKGA